MRFGPTNRPSGAKPRVAGFTLAEVLAAMVFMAIVIPVAVEGLRVANLAGQVAERKSVATRLGDQVLNELLVTGNWQQNNQRGTLRDGYLEYRWFMDEENWQWGDLRLLTVEVSFEVQGREYEVRLRTLADPLLGLNTSTNQTSSTSSTSASTTGGTSR